MALVTITGYLRDHGREPIPPELEPRLMAIPDRSRVVAEYVETDDEVFATWTNIAAGAWSLEVESFPGVKYRLVLDRLIAGQQNEPPENRSRTFVELATIWPGEGGPVSDLVTDPGTPGDWAIGFGDPPDEINVPYVDVSGAKPVWWYPEGSLI